VKNSEFKIGYNLICHTPCLLTNFNGSNCGNVTTIGKIYKTYPTPDYVHSDFYIYDDRSENEHHFTFEMYEKWFYTLSKSRSKKLKKLKNDDI